MIDSEAWNKVGEERGVWNLDTYSWVCWQVGEEESSNITVGQQLCLIANSCLGHIQNIWDQVTFQT